MVMVLLLLFGDDCVGVLVCGVGVGPTSVGGGAVSMGGGSLAVTHVLVVLEPERRVADDADNVSLTMCNVTGCENHRNRPCTT